MRHLVEGDENDTQEFTLTRGWERWIRSDSELRRVIARAVIEVFTDGSGGNAEDAKSDTQTAFQAGWGLWGWEKGRPQYFTKWGGVRVTRGAQEYVGAERATNNTAELEAIYRALMWIAEHASTSSGACLIRYDSEWRTYVVDN